MKKILMAMGLLFISTCLLAQIATIRGTIKSAPGGGVDISIYNVKYGKVIPMSTAYYSRDNGAFEFLLKSPEEGFYAIGYADISKGLYPVYVKKGDKVTVSIEKRKFQFVGKQTPENTVLSKWNELTDTLREKAIFYASTGSTYKDFFPVQTMLIPKVEKFRKTVIQTPNAKFNKLMSELTYFDMDHFALALLYTPRIDHPKPEDLPPYYSTIVQKNKYPNDDILSTVYGLRLLGMYADFAVRGIEDATRQDRLAQLSTDRQRGEYVWSHDAGRIKSYDQYENMVEKYGKYLQAPDQKERLAKLEAKFKTSKSGGKATNFTYPDKDGKMVSLNDFIGKVVVVDVWASWCVPCIKEMPHFAKLEEEFKDNDVVFMGVSIDAETTKERWQSAMKNKEGKAVQILAGDKSKMAKDYQIDAIPRFMVFDKKGNIVTIDAPKPSEGPRLKDLIQTALEKS